MGIFLVMDSFALMVSILVSLSLFLVLILRTYNLGKDTKLNYGVNITKYVVLLIVFIPLFLLFSVFVHFRLMIGQRIFWFVGFLVNSLVLNWLLMVSGRYPAKSQSINGVRLLMGVLLSSLLVLLVNELGMKISMIQYSRRYLYFESSSSFVLMFMYFFTIIGTFCASIIPSMLFVKQVRNKLEHILLTLLVFVSTSILLQGSPYAATWSEEWTRTFISGLIVGSTLILFAISVSKLKKIRKFMANNSALTKEVVVLYVGSLFLVPICFVLIPMVHDNFFLLDQYNLLSFLLFILNIPASLQVYLYFVVSTSLYISLKKKK